MIDSEVMNLALYKPASASDKPVTGELEQLTDDIKTSGEFDFDTNPANDTVISIGDFGPVTMNYITEDLLPDLLITNISKLRPPFAFPLQPRKPTSMPSSLRSGFCKPHPNCA